MFCKKCGNQIAEKEKYCSICGTPVEEEYNFDLVETLNENKNKPKKKIVIIGIVAVILIFIFLVFGNGDVLSEVKDSTLPSYSSNMTIGEAFGNFFSDTSWTSYESNGSDVVVFSGYFHEENGDEIKLTMEMTMSDNSLKWEEVILYNSNTGDTTYLNDVELESLLNAIFEDGTFTWRW